ncbi:MAG TPA: Na+/H+ antiporter NhaA [Mycobacteriales bacterium]
MTPVEQPAPETRDDPAGSATPVPDQALADPPRPGPATRLPRPAATVALRRFLATEIGSGLLLVGATVVALAWANSPWADSYDRVWATEVGINAGGAELSMDLKHWVDDGLMALFFLVVGLEVTREVAVGELRDRRTIGVPVLAALGGMVLPAAIFLAFNAGGPGANGWGVAMATDIAFVLGALALVGPRCPDQLRLFLLTVAIVDDIGAILVIAVFYSDDLSIVPLLIAVALVGALVALRWIRVWRSPAYVFVGLALWLAVYESGVHATIAGVLIGLLVATRAPSDSDEIDPYARALTEDATPERARLAGLAVKSTVSPNERVQHALHPYTSYLIVPVFALANAGIRLDGETLRTAATSPVTLGIVVALVVGKSLGITGSTLLALRLRLGVLPGDIRRGQLVGGATLAGIGFTVALFIADLAFPDPARHEQAVVGILVGSVLAAGLGTLVFRLLGERGGICAPPGAAEELPVLPPRPWREPVA